MFSWCGREVFSPRPFPASLILHGGAFGWVFIWVWVSGRGRWTEFRHGSVLLQGRWGRKSWDWGLRLRWGISTSIVQHRGRQSLRQHTWHLDAPRRHFLGSVRWCPFAQPLHSKFFLCFPITRFTRSEKDPYNPAPTFGPTGRSFRCG